jgi:hypothetical protein
VYQLGTKPEDVAETLVEIVGEGEYQISMSRIFDVSGLALCGLRFFPSNKISWIAPVTN